MKIILDKIEKFLDSYMIAITLVFVALWIVGGVIAEPLKQTANKALLNFFTNTMWVGIIGTVFMVVVYVAFAIRAKNK